MTAAKMLLARSTVWARGSSAMFRRNYSINGNEVKRGMLLEVSGELARVTDARSVKPGKGGAFQQVELRMLKTGKKKQERFRASEKVERLRLDKEEQYQVLYRESQDGDFILMHNETFEQISVPASVVGDPTANFLKDGLMVGVELFEGEAMFVNLPQQVAFQVEKTGPAGKDSGRAQDTYKDATLVGATKGVQIPHFVGTGDFVLIDPSTGDYRGRTDGE